MEEEKQVRKRRHGDRKDAYLVRDTDPMHKYMPYLLPKRTDSEAVMRETIETTAIEEYAKRKTQETGDDLKYTMFHVICAAVAKVIYLRPKMNYFYDGYRLYERSDISFSFIIKKNFEDHSDEALAIVKIDKDSDVSPIEQFHAKIKKQLNVVRGEKKNDGTTDITASIVKFPRFIVKIIQGALNIFDYFGWIPKKYTDFDPYHSSVFVSNIGSIKLSAQYHHLANWGTNSFFMLIGERKPTPFYDENGNVTMKLALELGLTIDERIADGLYFAKSIRLLHKLLENPELLDLPINTPVDYE